VRYITIGVACGKHYCGGCRFTRLVNNAVTGGHRWQCKLFKADLLERPKSGDLYRCTGCLKSEGPGGPAQEGPGRRWMSRPGV
jgi:hypothetical protein